MTTVEDLESAACQCACASLHLCDAPARDHDMAGYKHLSLAVLHTSHVVAIPNRRVDARCFLLSMQVPITSMIVIQIR